MGRAPISFTMTGGFNKTSAYLNRLKQWQIMKILNRYGASGVAALQGATPTDTGLTAASWYYTVGGQSGQYWLDFHNSHMTEGSAPVVVLLVYGHATRNGGYVIGRDFVNPAIAPIFDSIKRDAWKEVSKV